MQPLCVRQVYVLLMTVALAIVCSRIFSTVRSYEPYLFRDDAQQEYGEREMRPAWPKTRPAPMPTFSSNDRSRWATVRALVDQGTYVIGYRTVDPATGTYQDKGIIFEDGWQSIDRVLRPEPLPDRPNTYCFYSSKPPLFPTLLAGVYWLLKHGFGLSLEDDSKWSVIRIGLLVVNVLPLALYLVLLGRLLDRLSTSDWSRLFVMAAACFGTFVTLFAVSINNHTIATCSTLLALYPALWICFPNWFTADPKSTEPGPQVGEQGAVMPRTGRAWAFMLSGFFAGFTAAVELPAAAFAVALVTVLLWQDWKRTLCFFAPLAAVPVAAFFVTNYLALERWTPAYGEFGGPWYEYEGSPWKLDPNKEPRGIDRAGLKESRVAYAANLLVGHHGLFSLTPVFLLAVAGTGMETYRAGRRAASWAAPLPFLAGLTACLAIVVIGFYLYKTTNYGGWSNGPRWLMWLTPLWLLCMVPVVDRLAASRWGRYLALALLAFSVLSANYRDWNPWRHPWLYQVFDSLGWIPY